MAIWSRFKEEHPDAARFLVFFVLSNGVTALQLIMMPVLRNIFAGTALQSTPFQIFPVGTNLDGTPYFIFNYTSGPVAADGSGGGLAYFLAVQISLGIAQTINFFVQRTITFKSKGAVGKAAFWYVIAYIVITLVAGAAQGLYKAPIYRFFMSSMGGTGETIADIVTMFINSAISFWVFYPILKVIFNDKKAGATG